MAQPSPTAETVMVVDDEVYIRKLVSTILCYQGYEVLEAADGAEAARISAAHVGRIHLLISDLTLPRKNGPTLAAELQVSRPEMKVLFLSGYPAEEAERAGVLSPDLPFLQKPFAAAGLVTKVMEVLCAPE